MGSSLLSCEERLCRSGENKFDSEQLYECSAVVERELGESLLGLLFQDAADAAQSGMVSVIGLDSDKVQLLCDAANEEVEEKDRVQIANFLCPVRMFVFETMIIDLSRLWAITTHEMDFIRRETMQFQGD